MCWIFYSGRWPGLSNYGPVGLKTEKFSVVVVIPAAEPSGFMSSPLRGKVFLGRLAREYDVGHELTRIPLPLLRLDATDHFWPRVAICVVQEVAG
jgi:hypothetical protein